MPQFGVYFEINMCILENFDFRALPDPDLKEKKNGYFSGTCE